MPNALPIYAIPTARIQARPKFRPLYRFFHDYFITHLPSSSVHPDSRASFGPGHQLPRSASKPHNASAGPSPAPITGPHRDTTVVRIPLRSAKHHFGASVSRGTRPYNEDAFQAGVISVPAFAKPQPRTVTNRAPVDSPLDKYREQQRRQQKEAQGDKSDDDVTGADTASGDPQVFYFGVFDGHGGAQCSGYLSKKLHEGIEETANLYGLESTLKSQDEDLKPPAPEAETAKPHAGTASSHGSLSTSHNASNHALPLLQSYKANIGGYFRRFSPPLLTGGRPATTSSTGPHPVAPIDPTISTILTHAFLSVDLTFILEQQRLASLLSSSSDDRPINDLDSRHSSLSTYNNPPYSALVPQGPFKGGSTASIALVSTPTPTPFWHPSTPATITIAHVGDTRILLSRVSDGAAVPLTSTHHPSSPSEAARLRRWAPTSFDSFGEERILGSLANTRAFGDVGSKRLGVSAEPEITVLDVKPSEYAFMVLVSDGVTGVMADQEIVDCVKECRTPEGASREVVGFAVDVASGAGQEGGADNATALVVRLGGWERRGEGGGGGMGTREEREWRRREAGMGRGGRM